MLLAVGIGWSQGEYANLGFEFKNRGARMDEAIQVLRTAWRGSRVISYKGKHYAFEKAAFAPGPVQSGGPPLWVAGNTPKALRRAVMLSDGWHPVGLLPTEIERMLDTVRPLIANRPFSVAPRLTLAFEPREDQAADLSGSTEKIRGQIEAYRQAGAGYAVLDFKSESQSAKLRAMRRFSAEVLPGFAE
jgi:alkanesulfonate monooxygenase SsuD/methylene tetrahydromethanopterin reductase-like flavin-dependent oxidoreductase (luciferase family)